MLRFFTWLLISWQPQLREELARKALQGFFGDPAGFADMSRGPRRSAVNNMRKD